MLKEEVYWEEKNEEHKEDHIREEMAEKLETFRFDVREGISEIFINLNVVSRCLEDLHPSNVPLRHFFELKDDSPVYCRPHRNAPRHHQVVKEEIKRMIRAGIITQVFPAWSFPVLIDTKKDGKPRFCVYYRVRKQRKKDDRCQTSKRYLTTSREGIFHYTRPLLLVLEDRD